MNPGDLIKLNNQGNWVRVIPEINPRPLEMAIDYPPGTIALLIDILNKDERDGPTMETAAKIMVNGSVGFVWLYECEEIR